MQQSGDQKETRKEDVSILHDMLKKLKEHKVPKTGSKGQKQLKINRSYFIITIFRCEASLWVGVSVSQSVVSVRSVTVLKSFNI